MAKPKPIRHVEAAVKAALARAQPGTETERARGHRAGLQFQRTRKTQRVLTIPTTPAPTHKLVPETTTTVLRLHGQAFHRTAHRQLTAAELRQRQDAARASAAKRRGRARPVR